MKKLLVLGLLAIMAIWMFGCGDDTEEAKPTPTAVKSLAFTLGNSKVTLTWVKPDAGDPTSYTIYIDGVKDTTVTTTTWTSKALNNKEYNFEVSASNANGEGPKTSIKATPRPLYSLIQLGGVNSAVASGLVFADGTTISLNTNNNTADIALVDNIPNITAARFYPAANIDDPLWTSNTRKTKMGEVTGTYTFDKVFSDSAFVNATYAATGKYVEISKNDVFVFITDDTTPKYVKMKVEDVTGTLGGNNFIVKVTFAVSVSPKL